MDSDRGAQPERTVLAWRRTSLALAGAGIAVGRLALDDLGIGAVIIGTLAVAFAVASAWSAELWYRTTAGGRSARNGVTSIVLMTLTVAVSTFGAAIYLATRAVTRA
jgi:putative membrane protein